MPDEDEDATPIEVNLTAPAPSITEVEIGGDAFSVRIHSAAPLGEVVSAAENLYRLRSTQREAPQAGFGLPVADRRGSPEARGGSSAWPMEPPQ